MFRNSALILLTAFVASANGQCPTVVPEDGDSCSDQGQFCSFPSVPVDCGAWQCRCNQKQYVCSARGDGCKNNDSTDVEELDVGAVDEAAIGDASGGVTAAVGVSVVSSLIASGALAATVFGL